MRKILVTGGYGFIGSHFIRHMLKKYKDVFVINYDCLTYAARKQNLEDIILSEYTSRYDWASVDIGNREQVRNHISMYGDIWAVVNFAAETHVDRSIISANRFIQSNIVGTYNMLELARDLKIERFLQISTDEVYGPSSGFAFHESAPLNPTNPYSASKASGDMLVNSFEQTYGVKAFISRTSNNFGPCQYPEKLIPLSIINIIDGKNVGLYGNGEQIREWTYVEDNIEALDLILHHAYQGDVFNISSGHCMTNYNLITKICDMMGVSQERIEFVEDRPGHDRVYEIDSRRVRDLGWEPQNHLFDTRLEATIQWYMEKRKLYNW